MQYWLMKSEPSVYPWSRLVKEKCGAWDGVRNYQANNNMKTMQKGDQAFFYHSNEERAIVGIMEIVKTWHPDPSDETGRFGMVGVAPVKSLSQPVTLAAIKQTPKLKDMTLLRQSRLSVGDVTSEQWKLVLKMSGA